MRIEIGGGEICKPGWVNLDPVHGDGRWQREAQDTPWPIDHGSVESIYASHVFEHIPAGAPRIDVMNECWRVLEIGGTLRIIVPLFPSEEAIGDPTHISWWVERSFAYFTGAIRAAADYGILPWEQLSWEILDGWEGHWLATPAGK